MPAHSFTKEQEADIHAKVDFDMAIKRVEGNHFGMQELSFEGVDLTRKPEWVPKLCDALAANDTCTALNLSGSKLDLRGNAGLTAVGETVAQGLCRLRPALEEVLLGESFDKTSTQFVHDKKLVPGLTAWNPADLAVPGKSSDAFYCPTEISGEGVRIELTKGAQGTNGNKYRCELATFELYHQTGNMVLQTLAKQESETGDGGGTVV